MYAIIEDGGGQIRARVGDKLTIDLRELGDSDTTLTFDKVLMLGGEGAPKIGTPYVKGASVTADILEREIKGEKIDIHKYKRRKGYHKKQGHRQRYMTVKVTAING